MERLLNKLDEVIGCVKDSSEYKLCLELKEKMNNNEELSSLIKDIKRLQKKYIRSNYSDQVKSELDSANNRLMDIPIYSIYLNNLSVVNEKIEYIKDYLNQYFNDLLNKKY